VLVTIIIRFFLTFGNFLFKKFQTIYNHGKALDILIERLYKSVAQFILQVHLIEANCAFPRNLNVCKMSWFFENCPKQITSIFPWLLQFTSLIFGTFCNILQHLQPFAIIWDNLENFGTFWNILEHFVTYLNNFYHLVTFCHSLQHLEHFVTFCNIWSILEQFRTFFNIL